MQLQKDVVKKETYELLKNLMNEDMLSDFFLVGGTALALKLGHRISIDLDMFTQNDIPVAALQKKLAEKYGFSEEFRAGNTLKGDIEGVKVDFIKYDYPLIKPLDKVDGNIRIASFEDIIAMKLSAITDSGTRMKDFVDIAFLSEKYSLNQMLNFYDLKFKGTNVFSVTKALVYYGDVDFSDTVQVTNGKFSWKSVTDRLEKMISSPDMVFSGMNERKQKLNFQDYLDRKFGKSFGDSKAGKGRRF